ncbi:RNA-directed DNA polymerase, eukaryota [Tanacetum coccineum]|uniref:RNA-directed DNA polymerase, eukaryota n=1 Tax=Tanacetum coccineum TaxID=301880 RepID=A0ABQ5AER6_9ASTR
MAIRKCILDLPSIQSLVSIIMGPDDWQEVSRKKHGYRSYEDDVARISISVYVSNLPEVFSAKDLFHACNKYGHVVDSFIPQKRSKEGKRFGFVKFINVFNVERLVDNLCTVWIGRNKLQANKARFVRTSLNSRSSLNGRYNRDPPRDDRLSGGHKENTVRPVKGNKASSIHSFATVLKGNSKVADICSPPAMVLDEDCVVHRNLEHHIMGEVKCFSSIPNLYVLLAQEGFKNVKVVYIGGQWVMVDLKSAQAKKNFMQHIGVASWFLHLRNAQLDFVSKDRVVWVDIEGVPLHGWTSATFNKWVLWGKLLVIEEGTLYNVACIQMHVSKRDGSADAQYCDTVIHESYCISSDIS